MTTPKHIPSNQNYYDARFGTLSQQLNEEENRRMNVITTSVQDLNLPAEGRLADFGCGRGWLSNALSVFGKVTGFDLSQKAIENASASFPACQFQQLNAEDAIPEIFRSQFDIVVSSEVIEHIQDQARYLQNCAALLKTGGLLVLTTPNAKWKKEFYSNGREAWKQPLENWRSKEELVTLLAEQGFTVHKKTSFNSEWHFDFRPASCGTSHLSHPLSRKFLKLTKQYSNLISQLNTNNYGLNLIITAQKK